MLTTQQKTILVAATIALIAFALISVAVAALAFSQTINYTVKPADNPSMTTTTDLSPITYSLVDPNTVKTVSYLVSNNGNVPITVTASTTGTGASATWNSNPQTLAVGAQVTFTLTLTITGDGSTTVSFNAVKA
jgi:hypothetical protein